MCREQKQENRAYPAKRKPWFNQTSMDGLIRLIRWRLEKQQVCCFPGDSRSVYVRACEVGWSPDQLWGALLRSFLMWVCGAEACWSREAGSSSDNRQPGLVSPSAGSTPRLYPSLAVAGRAREKLLSPGCCSFTLSSARSLTLAIHPSLSGSPPPIRFLVIPASISVSVSLALSPLALAELLSMQQTHTCTHSWPKSFPDWKAAIGTERRQQAGAKIKSDQKYKIKKGKKEVGQDDQSWEKISWLTRLIKISWKTTLANS